MDLRISYTKCLLCSFDIAFSKDAVLCECTEHWYCSTLCRDVSKITKKHNTPGEESPSCNSVIAFYRLILTSYDEETLNMVKEYMRSKDGVSRIDIKKLAESGDWKAALVLGLTYEFRFVCESEECELAIRPPFVKSRPFSNRKAIKYYKMAAEQNSVEAFAGLGGVLNRQIDESRAAKDYFLKSSKRYMRSQLSLYNLCFTDLQCEAEMIQDSFDEDPENKVVHEIYGLSGFVLFRLFKADFKKSLRTHVLRIPILSATYNLIRSLDTEPVLGFMSYQIMMYYKDFQRCVQNPIFIQKADDLHGKDNPVVRIDPGVRMDARATFDPGYFQRLHHDQPMHLCEHDVSSAGNTCFQCAQLARERVLSVYENSFLLSRDTLFINEYYSVIFSLESGLKKQDYFPIYGKFEITIAIRVMALQPMDLHPLQLAKSPDIYWPVIHYYGSVYSALMDILDVNIVDSIYKNIPEFTPLPERRNRVDEEKYVIKCGYNPCVHLDWKYEFKKCSRCMRRRYCSRSCQELDWKDHKHECCLRPDPKKNLKKYDDQS